MRRVQATELHHDEEQAERPRANRDEEVLPLGPPAHPPQGDPVIQPERADGDRGPRRRAGRQRARVVPLRGDDLAPLVESAREGDRSAADELVRLTYADTYTL